MVGDFNAIMELVEKCGGTTRLEPSAFLLQEHIVVLNFVDVKPNNGQFTWNNWRTGEFSIAKRLDQFLVSCFWEDVPSYPLVGKGSVIWGTLKKGVALIKYSNLMTLCQRFLEVGWSRVSDFKLLYPCGQMEVARWKAPNEWLAVGFDEDYVELHNILSGRHCSSLKEKDGLAWLLNPKGVYTIASNYHELLADNVEDINKEAVEFFLALLSKDNRYNLEHQQNGLSVISKLITAAQNQALMKPIQFEDVRSAVFSMEGEKAPGPDGFPTFFYQNFWEIVGNEVWAVVEESRGRASVAKELNCRLIALIPKVEHPANFNEFRSCRGLASPNNGLAGYRLV
ncbi:uncharacterized protein LOC131858823 [Cryptomeria japonica]|uniref:uncharacterized protein LOC131858823 n=1 Tax=Cryptomeria japonica TaxID=3369 RepID=UPI0027DA7547|nr:uncharacterized protein LOC131858823 [Cryptomeria japonica]